MASPSCFGSGTGDNPFLLWKLKSCIGTGSFGIVWKAINKESNENVALKIIPVDKKKVERQRREFDISLNLSHENLVKVHRVDKTEISVSQLTSVLPKYNNFCRRFAKAYLEKEDIPVFIVQMEICGETLRAWLILSHDQGSEAVQLKQLLIIRGIVEGLTVLHNKQIIHRDLKPENILFSHEEFKLPIKIGDYGLCRSLKEDQVSDLTSFAGSLRYMAPEVWSNKYNFQCDIYSLGIIIWEVVQFLREEDLDDYIEELVDNNETRLIKHNPLVKNFPDLITQLTKKEAEERTQSIFEVRLMLMERGPIYIAENSDNLQQILHQLHEKPMGDNITIHLMDSIYEGTFTITTNNLTLIGRNEKTIFRNTNQDKHLLVIKGDKFLAKDFHIHRACVFPKLRRKITNSGIRVHGKECVFNNLSIYDCDTGIDVLPNANDSNCTINDTNFVGNRRGLSISGGGSCKLENIILEKCSGGIFVEKVDKALIKSARIRDPKRYGVCFFNVKSLAQLENVVLESKKKCEDMGVISLGDKFGGILMLSSPQAKLEMKSVNCTGFDKDNEYGLIMDDNCKFVKKSSAVGKIMFRKK